jgi:hypothetical protein
MDINFISHNYNKPLNIISFHYLRGASLCLLDELKYME